MTRLVSKCCKKDIFAVHCDEGTSYYVCRACDRASDPLLVNQYNPIDYEKDDDNGNVQSGS